MADTDELVDERQRELRSGFDVARRVAGTVAFIHRATQRTTDACHTINARLTLEARRPAGI